MTLTAQSLRHSFRPYVRRASRTITGTPVAVLSFPRRQCFHECSRRPVEEDPNVPVVDAVFWKEYKATFNAPKADFLLKEQISLTRIGEKVTAHGYLSNRRDLSGSLSFGSLSIGSWARNVQVTSQKGQSQASDAAHETFRTIAPNSAVSITGVLSHKRIPKRAKEDARVPREGMALLDKLEIRLESVICLNSFPRDITVSQSHSYPAKSRHLQLRFDNKLRQRIRFRSEVAVYARQILSDFQEIETPVLFKSTPEGANEFIVPTRKKGYTYALPQSPQQYKQILMAGGISRYVQFAKCFRDEDLRADRQPEFTQVDLEMAWATGDTVMERVENFVKELYQRFAKPGSLLEEPLPGSSFLRMTYEEAMSQHGSDKPDLRIHGLIHRIEHICPPELIGMLTSLQDPVIEVCKLRLDGSPSDIQKFITDFMHSAKAETFKENPDGVPGIIIFDPRKPIDGLQAFGFEGAENMKAFYATNSPQPFSGYDHDVATTIDEGDLLLIQAREKMPHTGGSTILGKLRIAIYKAAVDAGLMKTDKTHHYLWITDFPLFTAENSDDPGQGGTAGFAATHHPFTAPKSAEDVDLLLTDPLKAKADHYDLVVNGIELGGGSRRIHNAEMQRFIMREIIKMPATSIGRFNHLLEALHAGCPPHAGMALGFDRLIAVMTGQDSITEVMAFPKSSKGIDVMVRSPSKLTDAMLNRYHLQLKSVEEEGIDSEPGNIEEEVEEEPPSQA